MSFLVDTNVISELRKGARCNPAVSTWFAGVEPGDIYLSVLVTGEIRTGVERIRRRDPASARTLERWLDRLLVQHGDRILDVDAQVADAWGMLSAARPLPVVDGLLAATALVHGLTLVTRNLRDVAHTGVSCFDPFAGRSASG